jgi:hypothetical protein
MNARSVLAELLRPRLNKAQAVAEILETQQPLRLPPTVDAHELPPEFEDVLEVQVLGYRERLTQFYGHRLRVLDPVWTLVPKDR